MIKICVISNEGQGQNGLLLARDALLSCRDNSKLSFILYRATVILHQGQIYVIEMSTTEYICKA